MPKAIDEYHTSIGLIFRFEAGTSLKIGDRVFSPNGTLFKVKSIPMGNIPVEFVSAAVEPIQ